MKDKIKLMVIIAALALVIALALILYPKLSEKVKSDEAAETNGASSSSEQDPSAETAAGFTVYDGEGKPVSVGDSFGKRPVIINFWATWCPPCAGELPDFDEAYKKYGHEIDFYMVNLTDGARETVDGVKEYVAENGYEFPVYYDLDYEGSEAYAIQYIPVTVFIDSRGEIIDQQVGAVTPELIDARIAELLK